MESFRTIRPSVVLAPYVHRYWILETDKACNISQRVIPNGGIELMFNQGDRVRFFSDNKLQPESFIKGQHTGFYDLCPTGRVRLISIAFTPFGAKAFFQIPLNEFSNQSVDINDIGDILLMDLSKQISDATNDDMCVQHIEHFLLKRLNPLKDYNQKRLLFSIDTISTQKQVDIASLAETTCISYRQFVRVFTEHIGVNPKEYMRVVRFQKALSILENNPQISAIDLAFEAGYYDQSHLINEFKLFCGYTPKEYPVICEPRSDYFS